MKIKYIVVDELPKNCNECNLCRETKYLIDECMVIDNESLPFDKDFRFFDTKKGRHENCPLKVLKGNKDEGNNNLW